MGKFLDVYEDLPGLAKDTTIAAFNNFSSGGHYFDSYP